MTKLAIITTHPIQYNAPFFRLLTERGNIKIKVFYTWSQSESGNKFDPGFNKNIEWDIPLRVGYDYTFIDNISKKPGSHHYQGINNPSLIQEIKKWGASSILVYGWNFKSHFKSLQFFKNKIPIFFRGDSTLLDEKKGLKQIIRRLVLKYVYTHIDFALYTGKANKAYFKTMGVKDDKLIFMPHCVDNYRFAPNQIKKNDGIDFRKKLNIPKDALVFLFVGKLESKKQPEFLINAFQALKSQNAYLIMAGSGELEEILKKKFSTIKNLKFVGFQNQSFMPTIYSCSDVFILPSKGPNETWGLSINEAMAAGKAIIASDKCGAAYDLVKQNLNGFAFIYNDTQALVDFLQFFLMNKDATLKMGTKSLEIVSNFSILENAVIIENLCKNYISLND